MGKDQNLEVVVWDAYPDLDREQAKVPMMDIELIEEQPTTMEQELKITKEKVLEAASKCSTAAATLKTLFPEVFEKGAIRLALPVATDITVDKSVFVGSENAAGITAGGYLYVNRDVEVKVTPHPTIPEASVITFHKKK